MKVVVAGLGIMGLQIARTLHNEGNEVIGIELSHERVDRLRPELGDTVFEGDSCDPVVLDRAGMAGADVLLALTGDDEDNLVTSLLARSQFQVPRVISRINDPRNSWLFTPNWGVDVAMSAPTILLSLVEEATSSVAAVNLMDLATAGVRVLEFSVGQSSRLAGQTIADLTLPAGVVVATVIRLGHPQVPSGSTLLEAGDQLLIIAERDADSSLDTLLAGT